ncbi:DUF4248 domain-containing protein [Bacteroides thetaiotaomicron]|nr:DUF4248 domain-containing protein [Bacteroides thetaiotaomicron]
MIKVEKEVSNDYIIKGFKHFTQLATEYFQGHPDCNAARKRMRDTIDANLQLKAEPHRSKLHRTHDFAKSEDAANHLGALGTTHHFTVGKPRKRIGQQTSLNAQKAKIELYIFKYIIY